MGRRGGESEAESGELSAEDQRRWWFMSQLMTFALGRRKELKLIKKKTGTKHVNPLGIKPKNLHSFALGPDMLPQ